MRNVPSLETVYRDYSPKGVKFYYVYKSLAHPELNGYVQPVSLKERLMHVREAKRTLGTEISWLVDTMSNDVKHALGNAPNSEFIVDPEGRIVVKRAWSRPEDLRADLARLVGEVENPTRVDDLALKVEPPPNVAPRGIVPRIERPERLRAIQVQPQLTLSAEPFYVKLRAEVEQSLLADGHGKLYLAFHVDPIYHVHWNNLVAPLKYRVSGPNGTVIAPATGEGPKVEQPSDSDPREFVLDVSGIESGPLQIHIDYFACNDEEGWCKPVSQDFVVNLVADPDAGRPMRRRGGGRMAGRGSGGRQGGPRSMAQMMRRMPLMKALDQDDDGELSPEELENAPAALRELDQNEDGELSRDELRPKFGSRPGFSSGLGGP